MTDSNIPTNDTDQNDLIDETQTSTEPTDIEQTDSQIVAVEAATEHPLHAAFAQQFSWPVSLETSPDGRWLVWLQPNGDGDLNLWLSESEEGSVPFRVDLPFTPIEDRDPDSGRLLRGPQFSPDSTRIAVTGSHPDGDRTAVWIVPLALDIAPEVVDGSAAVEMSEDEAPIVDEPLDAETVELESEANEMEIAAAEQVEEIEGIDVAEDEGMTLFAAESDIGDVDLSVGGQQPFVVADHTGADRSPRWSPDGEILAMTSTIDGHDVISLASPNEPGGIEMLTWSREHSREPQWSRDGKFLAFLRPIGGGSEFHDIWSFSLEAGELTNLTAEKSPNMRHSIEWVPGRNLIAFVTIENDWQGISVVNADNRAGWVVTRESGDKTEPRFAPDEARLLYIRTEGFTTVVCERSLHSSAAVALDPGEGVGSMARWFGSKCVAYAFSAPQQPFTLFVQENTAKAERVAIQPEIGGGVHEMNLVQPQPLEFSVGPDESFSGLLYRGSSAEGEDVPGIVYLPDGPLATRRGSFQAEEQALSSSGAAVLSPVMHGSSGFGVAIEQDLREFANTEIEITDIAESARALGKESGIASGQIALVGHGFGGALALSTAGARPGSFGAVVVIDPVVDWTTELANANVQWRGWVTDRFGMPLTHADTYAIRTPATFSAVLDVPIFLVRTAGATASRRAQFDMLLDDLEDVGVSYTLVDAPAETLAATLRRVSELVAETFRRDSEPEFATEAMEVDEV